MWTVPWVWAGPVELDVRGRELWEKTPKMAMSDFWRNGILNDTVDGRHPVNQLRER